MPLVRKPTEASPRARASSSDILRGLVSPSPEERWRAARAALEAPEIASDLAAALPVEVDPRVREAMFTSLVRMGSTQISRYILPLLRSTDAALRSGALDALRSSSAAVVRELLPALLRDSDADVRILSCELARTLPSQEASPQLCALLLQEQETNVCAAAVEVLAEVGDHRALPVLGQCRQRFAQVPFLCFAIQTATARLTSQPESSRG